VLFASAAHIVYAITINVAVLFSRLRSCATEQTGYNCQLYVCGVIQLKVLDKFGARKIITGTKQNLGIQALFYVIPCRLVNNG
jgi:hypothetical protein